MYYQITVTKNGYHFFAPAEHSINTRQQLDIVYNTLKDKFPREEGYKISVTRWEKIGKFIEMN